MLEEIIEQNATILERLDDEREDEEDEHDCVSQQVIEYQKPAIVQVFETIFSWEAVLVLIVVALLIVPLFREVLD